MAATNFTPISLYYTTTAAAAPTAGNLVNGELAINITDGKLYYKDNLGVVKVIAGAGGAGIAGGSNTQVQFNSSGNLAGSSNMTFNGTTLSVAGLSDSGNLTFTGTGNRITGDFSTLTDANRVSFQSSTANGITVVAALPNGTSQVAGFTGFNNSDPTNSAFLRILPNATEARIQSGITGTGTYLPLTMYTNGSEKLRIAADATGTFTFSGTAPRITGDFTNATIANRVMFQTSTTNGNTIFGAIPNGTANFAGLNLFNNSDPTNAGLLQVSASTTEARIAASITGTGTQLPLTFQTNGSERLRIDTSGNVGIGTSSPAGRLDVAGFAKFGNYGGTFQGISLINNNNSASAETISFIDAQNNLAIADSNMFFGHQTDGGSFIRFDTTPAGSRSSDRRAERMRITSAGDVCIGTTSAGGYKVAFKSGAKSQYFTTDSASSYYYTDGNYYFGATGADNIVAVTNNTARMTIDSSGNMGIGTISPSERLHVVGGDIRIQQAIPELKFVSEGAVNRWYVGANINDSVDGGLCFGNGTGVGNNERMRIDSSGNLLVGTTSSEGPSKLSVVQSTSNQACAGMRHTLGAGEAFIRFINAANNAIIGSISNNGNTATSYNTSSDYRLKENIAPMTGALATVAQLKPVTYKWKIDGSNGQGFIAHELAEVCPDAVTGEKDAVDAEGKPVYQGIDTSFLVGVLTASIQELKAIVDAQAERIAVLESK